MNRANSIERCVLRSRARAAFTLVELLVTISIIALLVSILLPSLKRAREQAKMVLCTANLKGIAIASNTYATDDHNENAIPVHPNTGRADGDVGSYDWGGKAGIGEPTSSGHFETSIWGTMMGRGPATRPLNTVITKTNYPDYQNDWGVNQTNLFADTKLDMKYYRCPSDRGYTGHHFRAWYNSRLSSYDHYGTSYAANTLWCAAHSNQHVIKSWGPFLRPMSRIPTPANTVYFIENAGRFAWRSNLHGTQESCWTTTDGPHFSKSDEIGIVKGFHGKPWQFITAFVDGHAGITKIDGFHWPPTIVPVDPRGDPILARCHVLRGPGWQMDVLPTPPIFFWPENKGLNASESNVLR